MFRLAGAISFLFCIKLSLINGQTATDCVDQSWCTIPAFSSYCTNPQFRVLMLENCPRFCGVCSDPSDNDDVRCTTNNGGCEQICAIENDQVQCRCYPGYELAENRRNCSDINECLQSGNCPDFTRPFCINRVGSYDCSNQSCSQTPGYFNRYESDECCRDIEDLSCGRDTSVSRIVGGKKSVLGGWPWMVYILIDNRILCGGTLIHKSWVVTAAHCFREASENSTIMTFFGRINPYEHEPHVQERVVNQVILHENWDRERFPYHDIALMRLSSPVQLGPNADLACLPNGERPPPGTRCYVTGFGTTSFRGSVSDALLEVDLLVVDSQTCINTYKDSSYPIDEDLMFCAGRIEGGKDSCQGDSGGPLVCQRCSSCQWYLAGIVSFGRGCARPNFFGVYTDVEYYEQWISGHTGISVNKDKMCRNNINLPQRWARWGSWSSCSESCDTGTRTRTRVCIDGIIGSPGCLGNGRESSICNQQDCPVWSEYGDWSDCTVPCGGGTHTRERTCLNGVEGDEGCHEGSTTETMTCNEQTCPRWRNWGSWSACTVSCAGGIRTSERSCNTFGVEDAMCDGDSERSEVCQEQPCPRYENWSDWGSCSVSCSTGVRSRSRSCVHGNIGDIGCPEGANQEEESCNTELCGTWSSWETWSSCSVSCERGTQSSMRECVGGISGEGGCTGRSQRSRLCETQPCPVWESWSEYGECSLTCGGGSRTRTRMCENGVPGDIGCQGSNQESLACNEQNCPRWRNWGSWSACTVSCAGGIRTSERSCNAFGVEEAECDGDSMRSEVCQEQLCPMWRDWSPWSMCSVSCNTGSRSRNRECSNGVVGDIGCSGDSEESQSCDAGPCPVWGGWTTYGQCSRSCGSGSRERSRMCLNGVIGDNGCEGESVESLTCNSQRCPEWDSWGAWTSCSETCGGGMRMSSRDCLYGVVGDIGCSGLASRSESCNEQDCPYWSEYSDYGLCPVTCHGGIQRATRTCVGGTVGQLGCIGSEERTRVCNTETCPVWGDWVQTGECSRTCDRGQVAEMRVCMYGNVGLEGCIGPTTRMVECLLMVCPSFWSSWSEYGQCTVTCGRGTQTRSRICEGGDNPSCPGLSSETRECGEPCQTRWGEWGEWGDCSKSCSGGLATRHRGCVDGSIGEPGCSPPQAATDIRVCNDEACPGCMDNDTTGNCGFYCFTFLNYVDQHCRKTCNRCVPHQPWSAWMDCSVTCGGGYQRRTRQCFSTRICDGSPEEIRACNTDVDCSGYTQWSAWSDCSASCEGGMKERTRTCPAGTECLPDEHGSILLQSASCQTGPCPGEWQDWEDYSECSVTCGGGNRRRVRVCLGGEVGGPGCEGSDIEELSCGIEVCPGSWTNWTAAGVCSSICGPGVLSQTRSCVGGVAGGPGCVGETQRTIECNPEECITRWKSWESWESCSSSCKSGTRSRTRNCEHGNPGDVGCEGVSIENEDCNTGPTPPACVTTTPATTEPTTSTSDDDDSCSSFTDQRNNCDAIVSSCRVPEHFEFMRDNCRRTCCIASVESMRPPASSCVDIPFNAFYTCAQICPLPAFQAVVVSHCRRTCNLCPAGGLGK